MDIAKIRKKLKDADVKQSADAVNTSEAGASDETLPSGPDSLFDDAQELRTAASGPAVPDTGLPTAEEQNVRGDKTRYVSENAVQAMEDVPGTLEPDEDEAVHASEVRGAAKSREPIKQEASPGDDLKLQYKGSEKTEAGEDIGKADEVVEILTFSLRTEEFALRISQLKEILKYQRITEVPKMPEYVLGITSLRGKVIPVIDLRIKILPYEETRAVSEKTKILIIKGPRGMIGAVVDRVSGVMRIVKSEILPPPTHLSEEQLRFVEGVAVLDKKFVSIINMEEAININLR